jgi:predicted GH43/DUF377 family glycosyl hydrolase
MAMCFCRQRAKIATNQGDNIMIYPKQNILVRHPANPIVKPADMPAACMAVYNAGVTKTPAGEYVMASRFESVDKWHYIWVLRSRDGVRFTPDPEPLKFAGPPAVMAEFNENTTFGGKIAGWWDPRINPLDGTYYLTFAGNSPHGVRIGIARTEDFRTATPVSWPFPLHNYDAVLFPEKINGEYWMLHRPVGQWGKTGIWIASSPDLKYWGNCRPVAGPEQFWESTKIGAGSPPVRTEKGWLLIHHGVFPHTSGKNYSAGAMLLDLREPWKVVGRTKRALLFVEETYEMIGQVPNVVFPQALIVEPDRTVKIYYGAADFVECLVTGHLDEIVAACFER